MDSQEIWLQVPKSLRTMKGEMYLLNSYFHIFFSHQFLHHWAWKHYLGPEVVKVIESYFEFYKCEIVWTLRYHPSVTIWEKVPMHGAQK